MIQYQDRRNTSAHETEGLLAQLLSSPWLAPTERSIFTHLLKYAMGKNDLTQLAIAPGVVSGSPCKLP